MAAASAAEAPVVAPLAGACQAEGEGTREGIGGRTAGGRGHASAGVPASPAETVQGGAVPVRRDARGGSGRGARGGGSSRRACYAASGQRADGAQGGILAIGPASRGVRGVAAGPGPAPRVLEYNATGACPSALAPYRIPSKRARLALASAVQMM